MQDEPVIDEAMLLAGAEMSAETDELEAVLTNAKRLADAVIANVDDWAEGRAFAHALRESLRKYQDAVHL